MLAVKNSVGTRSTASVISRFYTSDAVERVPTALGVGNAKVFKFIKSAAAIALLVLIFSRASTAAAQQPLQPPIASSNISVRNEVQHAIRKGLDWLEKNQDAKGHWSDAENPAVTALALVAMRGDPTGRVRTERDSVKRGYDYLLSCAQPNGGIYKKEMPNYNTAVSMMALLASRQPEYRPILIKARQFLIGLQGDFDEPGKLDSVFDGGIGYGSRTKYSDMSNTLMALEALYYSKQLIKDESWGDARDLNWAAAIHFLQNCQNLPSHNLQSWVSDDPDNKGGFIYTPGQSMAGETNLPSGKVALRSYGSISYAGLLSYIYADLKKDDPRVVAVVDWLRRHFTLDENPGMGPQGLYYYYHTMAKALNTYGLEQVETTNGQRVNWRKELAVKLISLQHADGSWTNENGRWREKDAALVTAYAVIALEMIHSRL